MLSRLTLEFRSRASVTSSKDLFFSSIFCRWTCKMEVGRLWHTFLLGSIRLWGLSLNFTLEEMVHPYKNLLRSTKRWYSAKSSRTHSGWYFSFEISSKPYNSAMDAEECTRRKLGRLEVRRSYSGPTRGVQPHPSSNVGYSSPSSTTHRCPYINVCVLVDSCATRTAP